MDDDDTTLKRQSSNVTVDAAVAARMAEMSATPAKPPSFIRRGSSLSVPPAFVPVSESDSAGPRKQAPVEMPVSEMVPVQPVGHLDGRVTKFTNCRILRGHKLVREDLWIRCVLWPRCGRVSPGCVTHTRPFHAGTGPSSTRCAARCGRCVVRDTNHCKHAGNPILVRSGLQRVHV